MSMRYRQQINISEKIYPAANVTAVVLCHLMFFTYFKHKIKKVTYFNDDQKCQVLLFERLPSSMKSSKGSVVIAIGSVYK